MRFIQRKNGFKKPDIFQIISAKLHIDEKQSLRRESLSDCFLLSVYHFIEKYFNGKNGSVKKITRILSKLSTILPK